MTTIIEGIVRLQPDYQNRPRWLREEIAAIAPQVAHLSGSKRTARVNALLTPRGRAWFVDEACRLYKLHHALQEATECQA